MAACHIHSPSLNLLDLQLPAPSAAAPAPEAWEKTAPAEVADYLRRTCRRFNTPFTWQKGAPYPLSALHSPAHSPPSMQLSPPESWACLRDAHLAAPSEASAAQMVSAHQRSYVGGLEACLREAHRWQTPAPSALTGTGGITRPRHSPGQEDQDGPRGPPARLIRGLGIPAGTKAQPCRTTPLKRPRGTPTATPSPPPTTTAVPRHPSPAARPGTATRKNLRRTTPPLTLDQGAWHHHNHQQAPAAANPYPLMPQYYTSPGSPITTPTQRSCSPQATRSTRCTDLRARFGHYFLSPPFTTFHHTLR